MGCTVEPTLRGEEIPEGERKAVAQIAWHARPIARQACIPSVALAHCAELWQTGAVFPVGLHESMPRLSGRDGNRGIAS